MSKDEFFLGNKRKFDENSENFKKNEKKPEIDNSQNLSKRQGNTMTQKRLDDFFKIKENNPHKKNLNVISKLSKEDLGHININHDSELENKPKKIYSWNVNGLLAVIAKGAFEEFIKKEDPDIICLNETKLNNSNKQINELNTPILESYYKYFNNCRIRAGYSGVSVFSKIKPISIKNGIDDLKHDQEGRVITIEFETYFLIAVYVPNSGQQLKRLEYRVKEWDSVFFKYVEKLKAIKDVVVCGDFNVAHKNIDIFLPKGHLKYAGFTLEERNSFTKFLSSGFVDTFRFLYPTSKKFTFFSDKYGKTNLSNNKGWRLDYFLINKQAVNRLIDSQIMNEYDASDHSPIKLLWKV